MSVFEVCLEVKNFFLRDGADNIHSGTYTIVDGVIAPLNYLIVGQYFRIVGSVLNDGVYQYTGDPISDLKPETFKGSIWAMYVPPDFIKLCEEIDAWQTAYGTASSKNMSPFQSESIAGVYNYSKASGGSSSGGESSVQTWQSVYKSRLNKWRRLNIL